MTARGTGTVLAAVALAGSLLVLSPATGQEEEPTVRGSVRGDLAPGSRAHFEITATHPEGWQALHWAGVNLELHGALLEEIAYDVDGTSIQVGAYRAVAGTGNVAAGRFFRVEAFGVEIGTAGDRLRLSFEAAVLEAPPPEARFRFIAEDDEGTEVSRSVAAAVETDPGGLSGTTIVLAIVAALVAGGFVGSRVTAHRRPAPSVYTTVARRLRDSERPPSPPGRR
jgi:hypothetical protein